MSPLAAEMLGRMPEKRRLTPQANSYSHAGALGVPGGRGGAGCQIKYLAVIEAMKMENQLFAERDGVVTEIYLTPGDSLDVGELILELR